MKIDNKLSSVERMISLDVLKGIAIFSIVLFHTNDSFPGAFPNLKFLYTWGGYLGDYLFFMLSGFTIFYTYSMKVYGNQISLYSFVVKRIKKLYPMYFCTTLISIVYIIKETGISTLNFKNIFLNLTLTTSGWIEDIYPYNGPCWFLSQLLLCYIIWYAITKFTPPHSNYLYIGIILWGLILEKYQWNFPFCYLHNGEGFTNFFMGCLLCKIYLHLEKNKRFIFSIVIESIAFLFIVLAYQYGFRNISGDIKYVFTFLFSPGLIILSLDFKYIKQILEWRWLVILLGNISTSIFFWHVPFTKIFGSITINIPFYKTLAENIKYFLYLSSLYIFCFTIIKFKDFIKPNIKEL